MKILQSKTLKKIIILVGVTLFAVTLSGCDDNDSENVPTQQQAPQRTPLDPNRPPPVPNPDGTFG